MHASMRASISMHASMRAHWRVDKRGLGRRDSPADVGPVHLEHLDAPIAYYLLLSIIHIIYYIHGSS